MLSKTQELADLDSNFIRLGPGRACSASVSSASAFRDNRERRAVEPVRR